MPIRVATVRAADIPTTQTNIPVYVDLGRVGATALTLAEANSSRWYTDTDLVTQMAREIVSLTEGHGKYASLTSTSKIAIDYDGIRADYAVGDTYGRNAVWSNGFDLRYQMGQNPAASAPQFTDSTGGNNGTSYGTLTGTTVVTGKVGQGLALNNSGGAEFASSISYTGPYTVSIWINITAQGFYTGDSGPSPAKFGPWTDNNMFFRAYNGGASDTSRPYPPSGWNHIAVTRNSDDKIDYHLNGAAPVRLFADAAQAGTATFVNVGGNYSTQAFDGILDEARFASVARSANYITTEYNNQDAEATFWGTWTDAGGGGTAAQAARRGVNMMM